MNEIDQAREEVMLAGAYLLYAREAFGGRLTAEGSFSLDLAEDRFDEALAKYKGLIG